MRLAVSEVAERHLEQWADMVLRGELQLWQLPPAVQQFYHLGRASGRAERQPEIDHLEHECDLLYMQTVTPKERQQEYARRLETHFRLEAAAFFAAEEESHDVRPEPGRTNPDPRQGIEHQKRAA